MSKRLSKIIAVAAAIIMAFAFIMTGAFIGQRPVNAAEATEIVDAKIVDRVAYGDEITVPTSDGATVTVTDPSGKEITPESNKVTANQVGIYEITFTVEDQGEYASYTYGVECYMEYEYKLVVDNSKVVVPTYRANSDAFTLPTATLYYNDEEEEALLPVRAEDGGNNIFAKITLPSGKTEEHSKAELDEGVEITPEENGMYFITYYAKVGGGDNIESVDYTVQVQDKFEDTKAPTMSVNGVTQNSSTNTKFDIQPATVTDNFDGNRVVTRITVKHTYDGTEYDVPEVVVDKSTGYAAKDANDKSLYYKKGTTERYSYTAEGERETTTDIAEAVPAIFDNSNFMSFYPTEDGAYRLSYNVIDSTGNGEDIAAQTFTLTASDTTAPVVKSFDQSLIPSAWGLRVNKQDAENASATVEVTDTNIQFPIPELVDNNGQSNLTVTFNLQRSQNTKTFVSISNIYATEPSSRSRVSGSTSFGSTDSTYYFFRYWLSEEYNKADGFTVSETDGKISGKWTVNGNVEEIPDNTYSFVYYDDEAEKVTKGFFNFSMINDSNNTGTYNVRYSYSDGKNSKSNSYTIELNSSFTDATLPTVNFETPDHFVFREYETTQSITNVKANDREDARLGTEYYIIFDQTLNATDSDENLSFDENITDELIAGWLDAGNAIALNAASGTNVATLKVEDGEHTFTMDDVNGDEQTVTVSDLTKGAYVALRATDSVGQSAYKMEKVDIIDGTAEGANYEPVFATNGLNSENGKVGQEYGFGSFSIDYGSIENRNYVGFELYVKRIKDGDGKNVDNKDEIVSFETYSDNGTGGTTLIHVDNIRFTPTTAGTYMLVARGFHVSGKSSVKLALVTVESSGSADTGTATALPTDIEVNKTYYLETEYTTQITGDKIGILRSIKGGRFTLMGSEFVAKDAETYQISDYAFVYGTAESANATENSLITYKYADGNTGVYAGKSLANGNFIDNESESVATLVTSTASDSAEATFRVIGEPMPSYTPISKTVDGVTTHEFVKLPNVSASSATSNASKISVTVTDPNGNRVETTKKGDVLPAGYDGDELVGNEFLFEAKVDGTYTVTYTATMPNDQTASATFTIKAGDVIAPQFHIANIGSINGKNVSVDQNVTVSVNDTFGFAEIILDESESSTYTYSKVLYNPAGDAVVTVNHKTRPYSGTEPYTFTQAGTYRVVYSVTDAAGNTSTTDKYITVVGKSSISSSSTATLAIVLIIVGVLLIAGLIIYLIRFRKRKPKNN